MKRLAVSMAAISFSLAAIQASAADSMAGWDYFHKTYAAAEKAAKEQGKPLYLHFTTTWCGWCRRIENDVYKIPEGKKALEGFVCATLDCTRPENGEPSAEVKLNDELMAKYGGRGYPHLVMVTADGVLLHTISGYKPLAAFKEDIAIAEGNFKKYKEFTAYAEKADKAGLEYNLKALDFYGSTGAWAKAGEAAEAIRKLDPKVQKADPALVAYAMLMAAGIAKADEDKIQSLADEVVKADPTNAKGYMEKVLYARAQSLMRSAGPTRDKAKYAQAAAVLEQLITKAEKLSDKANTYGFMGFILAQAGKPDEAVAAMGKAVELEGQGPRAEAFKKYLSSFQKAKDQAATRPAGKE